MFTEWFTVALGVGISNKIRISRVDFKVELLINCTLEISKLPSLILDGNGAVSEKAQARALAVGAPDECWLGRNNGTITSINEQAIHRRRCCALLMTEVEVQP